MRSNYLHYGLTEVGRGDAVKRFFLAVKEAYFTSMDELEDSPVTPVTDGILKRKRSLVEAQLLELEKQPEPPVRVESRVRDALANKLGAATEVRCKYGMIDILSDTEIIEVKVYRHWKHALGQCVSYGLCFPGRSRRLHLYAESSDWESAKRRLETICEACSSFGVRVTLEALDPTYTRDLAIMVDESAESEAPPGIIEDAREEMDFDVGTKGVAVGMEDAEVIVQQQVAPPLADASIAYTEECIRHFIDKHCNVGVAEKVASSEFRERLLLATASGVHEVLGIRRVGIVMHKIGFKTRELKHDGRRCRGFGGVSIKPVGVE